MSAIIAYASRTGTRENLDALRAADWRLLVSARGPLRAEGFRYALDNGAWTAFQQQEPFDERAFERALAKLGRDADWCVMPDVVAGGARSLELSLRWMRRVLDATAVGMLAVQDGMSAADVEEFLGPRVGVFVGGSTPWKLRTMHTWCALAQRREAWAHIARVNSRRRISACVTSGATSFDGSSASRFVKTLPALDAARRQYALPGLSKGGPT